MASLFYFYFSTEIASIWINVKKEHKCINLLHMQKLTTKVNVSLSSCRLMSYNWLNCPLIRTYVIVDLEQF